jgi:hypothetical protein
VDEMTDTWKKTDSPASGVAPEAARLWAGRGSGKPCEFCGKAISADDVQYDLEVTEERVTAAQTSRGRILSFHLPCYDRWRASRDDTD